MLHQRKSVGHKPHGRRRGEDVRSPRDIFLEYVVLHRPGDLLQVRPLAARDRHVHAEENGGGGVDRHRRRHGFQRDVPEEDFHVGKRVDRHTHLPDLPVRELVVRIIPHLRRQVKRDRESRRPVLEEMEIAPVRLRGGAEPRILAHRPEPSAVHRGIRAPRKRIRPGRTDLPLRNPSLRARTEARSRSRNQR